MCDALLSGKSSWTGNLGATLNIPLVSAISSFNIVIETDLPVTKMTFWDADVSGDGTSFTITSKSWFGGQPAGGALALGFQVRSSVRYSWSILGRFTHPFHLQMQFGGATTPSFASITVNGVRVC